MSEYTPTTEQMRDDYVWWNTRDDGVGPVNWWIAEGKFDRWLSARDEEIVARTLLALAKPLHVELTAALDGNATGYVFEEYPGGGWRTWVSDARKLIKGETNE
jgi:hypothetical protein